MRKMAVPPLASGTLARRTTAARARRRRTRRPAGSAAARAAPTPQRGCCGCGSATENRANWCNPATTLSSPRASRPRSAWTWRACDTPVVQGRPRWDTIFRRTTFWCRPLARRSCQTSKLPSLAARRNFDVALVAELEKVEGLYERELEMLRQRWAHHMREEDLRLRASSGGRHISADDGADSGAGFDLGRTASRSTSVKRAGRGDYDSIGGEAGADAPYKRSEAEHSSLQRAVEQLFADAQDLVDFAVWNYAAFVKITKKRDKLFKATEAPIRERFCGAVRESECWSARGARALLEDIQTQYAALFTDGDRTNAELLLAAARTGGLGKHSGLVFGYDVESVRLGYRLGVAAVLCVWVIWDCFEEVGGDPEFRGRGSVASKPAWPLFRGCGELVAWHWLWGVSLHVWAVHRVNAEFLFDYEPSQRAGEAFPTARDVFDEAATETIVLLTSMLVYYKASYAGGLPAWLTAGIGEETYMAFVPVFLVVYTIAKLVMPWSRRRHMWRKIGRVVTAPCREVRFVDTYVADVLTSMVKILLDGLWSGFYLSSGAVWASQKTFRRDYRQADWASTFVYRHVAAPAVCLLPVWFRFAQCLRKYHDMGSTPKRWVHLCNASKYALSLFVSLFAAVGGGPLHDPLWFAVFVFSSLYSWVWDIYMDWGLRCGDQGLRMFHQRWYLVAAFFDVFGRFFWLATIVRAGAQRQIPQRQIYRAKFTSRTHAAPGTVYSGCSMRAQGRRFVEIPNPSEKGFGPQPGPVKEGSAFNAQTRQTRPRGFRVSPNPSLLRSPAPRDGPSRRPLETTTRDGP
ncbi:EXS family-domain-containing protein [Pelagophyceae sp. CCMP2097]|nr:EXS family-domain-containing protein [Pelagophyceae sp. CCMP2097]